MDVLKGKTVLIVDDEPDLREIMIFEFESHGCQIIEAENGKIAFDLFLKNDVDLVISDVRMPGGDGIELLEKIRGKDKKKPVIILVSGFADVSREEAIKKGANSLEMKPIDWDLLSKRIEQEFNNLTH